MVALSASAASASVVWTAGAEAPLSSEWASGNAYDVNSGAGTATTNAAWASTTRVTQVTSPTAIGAKAYAMTVLAGDQVGVRHGIANDHGHRSRSGSGSDG